MTRSTYALLWGKKNLVYIAATAFCVVYAVLAYVIPYHYTWFEWHRNLMAVGVLLLSVISVPIGLFLLFAGISQLLTAIIAMLYYAFAGIVLGKILKSLWQIGRVGKIALAIAFILNLRVGLFALGWADVLVTENPSLGCQNFITPEQGLQIITFEQDRAFPGAQYFYLFTADGGNSWTQLFTESHDDITEADCQTIQALSGDFLWIWSYNHLRTTLDGGQSWEKWDWECCTYGAVEEVRFLDKNNGTMTVFSWESSISELIAQDGGKTWLPVK